MKNILLVFIISLFTNYSQLKAQKIEKEMLVQHKGTKFPSYSHKLSAVIDKDLFIIYKIGEKNQASIVAYNSELQEKFSIPLDDKRTFPSFKYNPESGKIFVVESNPVRGVFNLEEKFFAKIYDLQGQEVGRKDFDKDFSRLYPSFNGSYANGFSENGQYFYTFEQYPKNKTEPRISVYDINLQELYTKKVKIVDVEILRASSVGPDGSLYIVFSNDKTQDLRFVKYDAKGQLVGELNSKGETGKKESYYSCNIKILDNRVLVTAEKNFTGGELMNIHLYDLNFQKNELKLYKSTEFNPEYVAKIYANVKQEDVLFSGKVFSGKYSAPKTISNMWVQDILVDGDAIYLISEKLHFFASQKGHNTYFADDILISAFVSGENKWNSVIGRNMRVGLGLGWEAIKAVVHQNSEGIHIVTSETPKGDSDLVTTYTRMVNKNTGQISSPQKLRDNYFHTFNNYACWLTPNQLVYLRSDKLTSNKKFYLNKVIF